MNTLVLVTIGRDKAETYGCLCTSSPESCRSRIWVTISALLSERHCLIFEILHLAQENNGEKVLLGCSYGVRMVFLAHG